MSLLSAQSGGATIELQVSNEAVPAGNYAQIKVFLAAPQPISSGKVFFTFDGADYPDSLPAIDAATVFSAAGDAMAIGAVGCCFERRFAVWFSSPSAGVGRLPELPIVAFSLLVTKPFSVSVDLLRSYFYGPDGQYVATVKPGAATMGGSLSIRSVTLAGSALQIDGAGFTDPVTVTVDGASVASVEVTSPTRINATLAAPTEITGKRIRVRNAGGDEVEHWGAIAASLPDAVLFYTFPLTATSSAVCGIPGHPAFHDPLLLALQNLNPEDAQATITNTVSPSGRGSSRVTIPAGGTYTVNIDDPPNSTFQTSPTTAVRALCFAKAGDNDFELLTWIPITVQEQPAPYIARVTNAASQIQAAVSPGEMVTIYGATGDAPAQDFSASRLLFDGVPARILYASSSQVNAIVPGEIGDSGISMLELEDNGVRSAALGVPLAPAAPGIFTLSMTGKGQAAIFNEDGTVNGPSNPAPRGSTIQILATGLGGYRITEPDQSGLPVVVSIGGRDALGHDIGTSADVAGLRQVRAQVPSGIEPGSAVPIRLAIGTAASQAGVTIAVK